MKKTLAFISIILIINLVWGCKGSKKVTKKELPPPVVKKKPIPTPKTIKIPPVVVDEKKTTKENLVLDTPTIKKLQILLFLAGYSPGRVNGEMKPETKAAAAAFNKDISLVTDSLSQETLKAIGVPLFDFELSKLQQALEDKQYDPGPVDNLVGRMTKGAYVKFLDQHGFPKKLFTKATKEALFSTDKKYDNKELKDDLFFEDKENRKPLLPDVPLNIQQAALQDVQRALFAQGYDPGPTAEQQTPQFQDALFKYQVDKKLPIGGLNIDTLRALGFR